MIDVNELNGTHAYVTRAGQEISRFFMDKENHPEMVKFLLVLSLLILFNIRFQSRAGKIPLLKGLIVSLSPPCFRLCFKYYIGMSGDSPFLSEAGGYCFLLDSCKHPVFSDILCKSLCCGFIRDCNYEMKLNTSDFRVMIARFVSPKNLWHYFLPMFSLPHAGCICLHIGG